ncbi:MAG TPA: acyl-CoA dehydrogenase family protein [Caulobacteraceae bacterium]
MAYSSPWIDEELSILQDHVERFLQRELVPDRERWEDQGFVDRAAWLKAGEAGLLCASVPEAYGGGGGNRGHEAVIIQEMGRAGLAGGFGAGAMVSSCIVAHYILGYGTEAQKLRWLPAMATGEIVGAIAMSEPGAGSDLQGISTAARKVDGGYVVNGSKTWITNGQCADLIVTVCKTDPDAGSKGISLLAVEPKSATGFKRGKRLSKLGMHAQDTSELFFDDVFVPDDNLLGAEAGRGFIQLMQQLAWERLQIALTATVAIESAVGLATDYVKQRKLFGKQLLDFQNTQFKLAECKTQAVVARRFVDSLMVDLLAGTLEPETAAMAKLWATETQGKVIDECLQLFGGYGYVTDYPIARLYADARITRIFGGTSEVMKLIISRTL